MSFVFIEIYRSVHQLHQEFYSSTKNVHSAELLTFRAKGSEQVHNNFPITVRDFGIRKLLWRFWVNKQVMTCLADK